MSAALLALLTACFGGFTSLLTYLLSNSKKKRIAEERRQLAEAEKEELTNAKNLLRFWKENCTDLLHKIELMTHEMEQLRKENEEFRKENHAFRKEMHEFKKEFKKAM